MKKLLCIAGFLALAAQLPLWGYDMSPSSQQVIPEVIWAAATGGGTWVTEVQIVNCSPMDINISVEFYYSGGYRALMLYGGLGGYSYARFSNVLSQMQTIDSSFAYYGRVGALWINASSGGLIHAQARTVNGNYGKTFPGLNIIAGMTAAPGRLLIIQDIVRSVTYRTSVGFFNPTAGAINVGCWIDDETGAGIGSFTKTVPAHDFQAFNPFTQAGITSGTYENCVLYIEVSAGGGATDGLMCYGSIANNFTNDTYALIARMFQ